MLLKRRMAKNMDISPKKHFGKMESDHGASQSTPYKGLEHNEALVLVQEDVKKWFRYPIIAPIENTTGIRANPLIQDCLELVIDSTVPIKIKPCAMLVESVNSAIMVFMTPIFPFNKPARHRLFNKITLFNIEYLKTRNTPENQSPESSRQSK